MISVGPDRTSHDGEQSDDEALRAQLADALAQVEQLSAAIVSRDVIATAKGLLMAQQHLSSADAFEVLRRASQRENVRVRDIAERMVGSHDRRVAKPSA